MASTTSSASDAATGATSEVQASVWQAPGPSGTEDQPSDAATADRAERRAGCATKAEKREARKRSMDEAFARKKIAKKEAKKVDKAATKTAQQIAWDALSTEEQEAAKLASKAKRESQQAESVAAAAARAAADPMPACAVDLDFDGYMEEREITSLSQQVRFGSDFEPQTRTATRTMHAHRRTLAPESPRHS